jgi:hypothetical protein
MYPYQDFTLSLYSPGSGTEIVNTSNKKTNSRLLLTHTKSALYMYIYLTTTLFGISGEVTIH